MTYDIDSDAFRWWVTGLADGESYFRMYRHPTNKSWTFMWGVKMRADDRPMLERVQLYFGGKLYGVKVPSLERRIANNRIGTKPAVALQVFRSADLLGVREHFTNYPLQSKKVRDFEVWKKAFTEWTDAPNQCDDREGRMNPLRNRRGMQRGKSELVFASMAVYHQQLKNVRQYVEEGIEC